jgi:hypothetical protein
VLRRSGEREVFAGADSRSTFPRVESEVKGNAQRSKIAFIIHVVKWYSWGELNHRPPDPQAGVMSATVRTKQGIHRASKPIFTCILVKCPAMS